MVTIQQGSEEINSNGGISLIKNCIPFTGDSIDWEPQWKKHPSDEDLKNRLLVFELRMESGEVWSLCGDFTLLGTTEAFRYEAFRTLPSRSGF